MAAKARTVFFCTECGFESARWLGCCTGCSAWNTFTEFKEAKAPAKGAQPQAGQRASTKLYAIDDISVEDQPRLISSIDEWDRVSGGGILPGAFIILTGDPGVGKRYCCKLATR